MNRLVYWLTDLLARTLAVQEGEAVRGDLEESGEPPLQALFQVLGLVVRRQAALWQDWRPWLALVTLAIPLAIVLNLVSRRTSDGSAIYLWMYANNWDWDLFRLPAFRHDLLHFAGIVVMQYAVLACWSWTVGLVLGSVSRRTIAIHVSIFSALVLFSGALGIQQALGLSLVPRLGREFHNNAAAFGGIFYRVILPPMLQVLLVLLPAMYGVRDARRVSFRQPALWLACIATLSAAAALTLRPPYWGSDQVRYVQFLAYWPIAYLALRAIGGRRLMRTATTMLALGVFASAQTPVRAGLQATAARKSAPQFALKDSSGETVTLKQYHGKVVLLDFWATWCHGCKEEIPWFAEFHRKYAGQGLSVIGVSLDEEGWKIVKPFLHATDVPYRIVLGTKATAASYGIQNMPDTYLIDRDGRIAAAYVGMVDRVDIEANLRALLAQK